MGWRWVAKAVVQKAVSYLPDAQRVNYVLQNRVSKRSHLSDEYLQSQVRWAGGHLDVLRRHCSAPIHGFQALELGTGWYPIIPCCLFLAGSDQVWMVDLEDLGRAELTSQGIRALLALHDRGELEPIIGEIDSDRLRRLTGAADAVDRVGRHAALAALGIRAHSGDASRFTPPEPPDLICSNTVLEHIAPPVLERILRQFSQIAAPGTVMSHLVDHCDHYAYIDPSVSVYQFLRFSDRAWKLIDNSLQPMNRLRASDYRSIYGRLGIDLTEERLEGCNGLDLVGEPLAPRYKAMDPNDVACTSSWLITRFI